MANFRLMSLTFNRPSRSLIERHITSLRFGGHVGRSVAFEDMVKDEPVSEIGRLFVTALFLANKAKLNIAPKSRPLEMDKMLLTLLPGTDTTT